MEMSEDIKKIVAWYDLRELGYELEIPAAYFLRGWAGPFGDVRDFDDWVSQHLKGWDYQEAWSNGYRSVYTSAPEKAILTYVGGDVDLTVDESAEMYWKRLGSAEQFYARSN